MEDGGVCPAILQNGSFTTSTGYSRSDMLIGVCRIGGFGFDIKNDGFTFRYVSGRQQIAFDFGF
jgi:hypothetical protein